MSSHYSKVRDKLLGKVVQHKEYWAEKNQIPVGSVKPHWYYDGKIPEEEIITIPFDSSQVQGTSRNALNVLCLGGQGDGKSLMMKMAWYVLQQEGYYIVYIDPKSFDSGRAKQKWGKSPRLPPRMQPDNIPLRHYVPSFATNDLEHMIHNFRVYSNRLEDITEPEMWQNLGMTIDSANVSSQISEKAREEKGRFSLQSFLSTLENLDEKKLSKASEKNAQRVIRKLSRFNFVDHSKSSLDFVKDWDNGKSVCISYYQSKKFLTSFDIGLKIYKIKRLLKRRRVKKPVFFFFDDAGFYAKDSKIMNFNYAVDRIKNIGFLDRSIGLNDWLSVQSLDLIEDEVVDSFRVKLVSPKFENVSGLKKLRFPKKAINLLKNVGSENGLVVEDSNNLIQWLKIDDENNVEAFFPFTPPCNHFKKVYKAKWEDENNEE